MKFLLDVNVGSTIAKALVDAGHDVARAAISCPRAEDSDLLARAAVEARFLITYDRDFGELIFSGRGEQPAGVIYIRYEPDDLGAVVDRLMKLLDETRLGAHMTVIDARRVRRTPFPIGSNDNG